MTPIAALYVDPRGVYSGLEGVECWGEDRDARLYPGPHPVVAHPPCSRWCQLAYIVQKRYGHLVGDDGGCFAAALASVRAWGGVLEHPAFTYAWAAFSLPRPPRRGWQRATCGGWVCEVSQAAYGHRARKLTWLYYVGESPPPMLDWRRPRVEAGVSGLRHNGNPLYISAQVSFCANHGDSPLPRLSKREASSTPLPFRDVLIEMARSSHQSSTVGRMA